MRSEELCCGLAELSLLIWIREESRSAAEFNMGEEFSGDFSGEISRGVFHTVHVRLHLIKWKG